MMLRLIQGAVRLWPWLLLLVASSVDACGGRVHIEVGGSQVYALDYAAIVAVQPELKGCKASELSLHDRGVEVPIRIVGADDGRLGRKARIEWLGQRLHGPESWFDPYSNVNVYLLSGGPGKHARLHDVVAPSRAAKAATLMRTAHFEDERLMIRLGHNQMKDGEEPDVWQWAKLTPIDPKPFAYDFDLPDLNGKARGKRSATKLTLDFRGISQVRLPFRSKFKKPADHAVVAMLNGHKLKTFEWNGRDEIRRTLEIAHGWLKPKGNRVELRVAHRNEPWNSKNFIVDVVMFNWMQISYPVRGDIDKSHKGFSTTARTEIGLQCRRCTQLALIGSDGSYRPALALGDGKFRAAAADSDVTLYPLIDGQGHKPGLVRAVTDRDLRAANPGHDYLIVAHPRLLKAIQPLADYHRAHGYHVAVYNVDDVYDEFNHGISHPVAIRNLVAWGYKHWKLKPHYLLLVGDASADIHNDIRDDHNRRDSYALRPQPFRYELLMKSGLSNMPSSPYSKWDPRLSNRNLIPTWQYAWLEGQGASDNGFVALKPGDIHPMLAVGRFPVVEPAEVTAIVDKTIDYLSKPSAGSWRRDVTFISTDEVAYFKKESDKISQSLAKQGYAVTNIYTKQDAKDAALANRELKRSLDRGDLLVHFLGHGGAFIWRVGPPADLFTLKDVGSLTNKDRYPMVLAMTCFSAPFDNPTQDSIGEKFLREANKGAIAVFAASWMNSPNPKHSKQLVHELLKPDTTIGDAIMKVKQRDKDRILIQMYNLLGDPAVELARPHGDLRFQRAPGRWKSRLIVRVPETDFGGNVDVDWFDSTRHVIASRRYQARDRMFSLPILARSAEIRVFTGDTRNGLAAFGSYQVGASRKNPGTGSTTAAAPHPGGKKLPSHGTGAKKPSSASVDDIKANSFDTAKTKMGVPAPGQGGTNKTVFQ